MQNQIEIFQGANNEINVEVKFEDDTVWLSQAQIIKLFNGSKSNISEHIKYIFESEELTENSTVRNFRTVQMEGKRTVSRDIIHYNLDVIISVGYRVNSKRGIQFRQWATQKLKDFLVKGSLPKVYHFVICFVASTGATLEEFTEDVRAILNYHYLFLQLASNPIKSSK
jgi:hypothetical protein